MFLHQVANLENSVGEEHTRNDLECYCATEEAQVQVFVSVVLQPVDEEVFIANVTWY